MSDIKAAPSDAALDALDKILREWDGPLVQSSKVDAELFPLCTKAADAIAALRAALAEQRAVDARRLRDSEPRR